MDNGSKIELTFGKHKGERLGDVPAGYLLWLGDQEWLGQKFPEIKAYIEKERRTLEKEANGQK